VLYEAHSIRSLVPRLFEGELPNFNIGTNSGASCSPTLTAAIEAACSGRGFTHVTNGRFKGGWTTRHYGNPERDIHAVQMELACRGYMTEPTEPFSSNNWPSAYDPAKAAMLRSALLSVMSACVAFATTPSGRLP
jgi:N-formylglutamate deformylase